MSLTALLFIGLLVSSAGALAQGAAATTSVAPAAIAREKPTADQKRCLASRRRAERQHEVIAQADARVAREQKAREACKTKRACESLDRALEASHTRQQRHEKQRVQFQSEASKACAHPPQAADYRKSTAVTSSPTTTNAKSTK